MHNVPKNFLSELFIQRIKLLIDYDGTIAATTIIGLHKLNWATDGQWLVQNVTTNVHQIDYYDWTNCQNWPPYKLLDYKLTMMTTNKLQLQI